MSKLDLLRLSRLSAIWLFWPALFLVVWGELAKAGAIETHVWDKLLHFTAYAGLSLLGWLAIQAPRRAGWAVLSLILFGGVLEILQGLIGRDMSLADEMANAAGALFGAGLGWLSLLLLRHVSETAPGTSD